MLSWSTTVMQDFYYHEVPPSFNCLSILNAKPWRNSHVEFSEIIGPTGNCYILGTEAATPEPSATATNPEKGCKCLGFRGLGFRGLGFGV